MKLASHIRELLAERVAKPEDQRVLLALLLQPPKSRRRPQPQGHRAPPLVSPDGRAVRRGPPAGQRF